MANLAAAQHAYMTIKLTPALWALARTSRVMDSWTEIREIGKKAVQEGFHKYAKGMLTVQWSNEDEDQRCSEYDANAERNQEAEHFNIASQMQTQNSDVREISDT